jgi:hypothetical protein
MRTLLVGVLVLLAACDPAAIAHFDVRPRPGRNIDSSFVLEATRVGRDFAQRYQLVSRESRDCPGGAYYSADTARGRPVGLTLCLGRTRSGFRFRVSEIITFSWGPKGTALRDELADTLRSLYGDGVEASISRH